MLLLPFINEESLSPIKKIAEIRVMHLNHRSVGFIAIDYILIHPLVVIWFELNTDSSLLIKYFIFFIKEITYIEKEYPDTTSPVLPTQVWYHFAIRHLYPIIYFKNF